MAELLTAAQMRAVEAAAITSGEVSGLELMERAGAGVVSAIVQEWPELGAAPQRAVVLCGPGNNGGDGFVVARLLAGRGWEVEVFLYGDAGRLPPDARRNYDRWCTIGSVAPLEPDLEPSTCGAALVVDALFGTGLTRPIRGLGLTLLDLAEQRGQGAAMAPGERPDWTPLIVAVDLPSGLCSDSGRVLRDAAFVGLPKRLEAASARADLTVSFHARKLGHVLAEGPEVCGKVVVVPIGLDARRARAPRRERAEEVTGPAFLGKQGAGHKYSHGHALVLSGGFARTGAARLAARAALRIGAGLVTLGAPGAAQMEVAAQITALMLRRVEEAEDLAALLEDARYNALCLGPGLGLERARDLVPVALEAGRAVLLDADALSGFSDAPDELFAMLHEGCVLTPHDGEFARLFPDLAERLAALPDTGPAFSRADAAREAARRAGCVLLLKGPDTVIAAPDGRCSVHAAVGARAAPWLATAGAGDVLAGLISGLMARGFSPFQAACSGAWLHVEAARRFGPGLIAEDLPEALPGVLRGLGV
ncbi:NAD(P)H-hydrate dehydratase [Salipiger sp. P9]|uniref:NAD(P)H-hydrate dehydratase n=1 Tax=Salipiger pentaromativorans TaxID=2943193 RepID=UPI002157216E|nr:NAD(P)H-hydrate dehydratase [Salipiger pentaromativorans]MCR8550262.1 NAD(P)H-hydrate dehydratase [Salipiger pentaromativorans]